MKIVGLEEHYVTPEVVDAWNSLDARWQDPAMAGWPAVTSDAGCSTSVTSAWR